jgi:hypothetical protein
VDGATPFPQERFDGLGGKRINPSLRETGQDCLARVDCRTAREPGWTGKPPNLERVCPFTVKYKIGGEGGNFYVLGVCTNISLLKDELFKTFCEALAFRNSADYQHAKEIFENGIDHSVDHITRSRGEG